MLRYLRIAFSVTCGILCLLLIALWVRSYSIWDELVGEAFNNTWIQVRSLQSQLMVCGGYDAISPLVPLTWSSYRKFRVSDGFVSADDGAGTISTGTEPAGFRIIVDGKSGRVSMPHWFPSGLFFGLAAVPWFRWRFSLRTLLIAMTLAAVVLGLIAVSTR